MADLHPQARVLLVFVIFLHMVPSFPYGPVFGRVGKLRSPFFTGDCDSHTPTLKLFQRVWGVWAPLALLPALKEVELRSGCRNKNPGSLE